MYHIGNDDYDTEGYDNYSSEEEQDEDAGGWGDNEDIDRWGEDSEEEIEKMGMIENKADEEEAVPDVPNERIDDSSGPILRKGNRYDDPVDRFIGLLSASLKELNISEEVVKDNLFIMRGIDGAFWKNVGMLSQVINFITNYKKVNPKNVTEYLKGLPEDKYNHLDFIRYVLWYTGIKNQRS